MSVLVRYQELGMTRRQYDDAGGRLEQGDFPPAGLEFHLLHGEEGSLRVSEVRFGPPPRGVRLSVPA